MLYNIVDKYGDYYAITFFLYALYLYLIQVVMMHKNI